MAFEDLFSGVAGEYRRFRPRYPSALFDALAAIAPGRDLAWDACAGSGQASLDLAGRFARVLATDASAAQVATMPTAPGLLRAVARAELTPLPRASVDLVTVAQALHWVDLEPFYAEVRRVAKPDGVVAVWSYGLFTVSPGVDAVAGAFYRDVVGPYWPTRRRHVERGYRDLPFPFERLEAPDAVLEVRWDLASFCGYLRTWSATKRWRTAHGGYDPVADVEDPLRAAWGDPATPRTVRWPLTVHLGRVHRG